MDDYYKKVGPGLYQSKEGATFKGPEGTSLDVAPSTITLGTVPKDRVEGYEAALARLESLEATVVDLVDIVKGLVSTFNLQAQTVDHLCRTMYIEQYDKSYKRLADLNIHTDQEIRKILSKDFGEN